MKKSFVLLSLLAVLTFPCSGTTIVFGGTFFADIFSADGTDLESGPSAGSATGEVTFRLGVFAEADEFGGLTEVTPTLDSVSDFSMQFLGLATSDFDSDPVLLDDGMTSLPANHFGSAIAFDTSSTLSQFDGSVSSVTPDAIAGFQLYIFGYDSFQLDISNSESELFLVTGDDFIVPDVNAPDTGNGNFPIVVDINTANTAIIGRIDDSTGGGETMGNPNLGPDGGQFAVVPEPSAIMLLFFSGVCFLRRRR